MLNVAQNFHLSTFEEGVILQQGNDRADITRMCEDSHVCKTTNKGSAGQFEGSNRTWSSRRNVINRETVE